MRKISEKLFQKLAIELGVKLEAPKKNNKTDSDPKRKRKTSTNE